MKTLIALLLSCLPVFGLDAVLSWESASNSLSGYHIYTGTNSHQYYLTNTVTGGTNTSLTILGLQPGRTYYFNASSTATNGLESDLDTELVAFIPAPPVNIKLRSAIQGGSGVAGPWNTLTNYELIVEASTTNQFFRNLMQILK